MDATLQDPFVGRLLDDRYVVVDRIAAGGMATVYHALDRRLDRNVAVKVLHAHLARDEGFATRFDREARSAARLSHPNVVAVFDQGRDGDLHYLAMEYLPGRTLRQVLAERGALTPKETIRVMDPVLDALTAAHRAGIVHRDVKPENVILTDDGRVKVADFGLARAATATSTTTGVLLGTVAYLAPELVVRGAADPRSDVYAAGVMLYEMLTGRQPFEGEIPAQVAYRHVHEDVPPPSRVAPTVPEALDEVVLAATAREPDERPADAAALLTMLRNARRLIPADQLDLRAEVPVAAADTAGLDPFDGLAATQAVDRAVENRTQALPNAGVVAAGAAAAAAATAANGLPTVASAPSVAPGTAIAPAAADLPPSRTSRRGLVPQALPVNEPHGAVALDDAALARYAEQRRRRGLLVMALVLATALVLVTGAYWFIAGPGATAVVPATNTLTQAEATKKLQAEGFKVRVTTEFSETIKKGLVVASDPVGGESARKGGVVTLTVSKGPQLFEVPDVTGHTKDDASKLLTDNDFRVGKVSEEYSTDVETGLVISSSPAAGSRKPRNTTIALVLSKGPAPVDVPDVRNQPEDQATQALEDAGFDVTVSDQPRTDPSVPAGSVVAQDPQGGSQAAPGSTVTIYLSQGADLVEVPNVLRDKEDDARRKLEEAGFQVNVVRQSDIFRRVGNQNPFPGTQAPRGSTVTIVIL